ncbi:MAG: sulfate ABC transporter permease subunit [Myxococcota bacterium]
MTLITPKKPIGMLQWGVVGVAALYLGVILLLPMTGLLSQLLAEGKPPVLSALEDPSARFSLGMSLALAVLAALFGAVFGIAGALALVRGKLIGRTLLDALVDMPLAISPVMAGLAFLLLYGRGGWLEPVLALGGLKVKFALPGIVIATLFVTLPYVLREVEYVLIERGTSEEEAAACLGASRWQTFWNVTLPNIRFALGYGVILTTARALGEFGAVLVLGGAIAGQTQTATTFIYAALDERKEVEAYGMAILLAAASLALLGVQEWLKHKNHAQQDERNIV